MPVTRPTGRTTGPIGADDSNRASRAHDVGPAFRDFKMALQDGCEGAMRDLARLAIAAFGRQGEGSGVIGVDVQRIRRQLGLRAEPQPELPPEDPRRDGLPRDQLRRFEQLLRRELERGQIERTEQLPAKRPLNELDRALPTGAAQDLAQVHRVVAQLGLDWLVRGPWRDPKGYGVKFAQLSS